MRQLTAANWKLDNPIESEFRIGLNSKMSTVSRFNIEGSNYKILFGLVLVTSDEFFTKNFCTSTRGHQYKLYRPKHHTSACVRSNFFAERVINAWNNLPESVDFSTLSRFKRTIKRVRFDNLRF